MANTCQAFVSLGGFGEVLARRDAGLRRGLNL